MRDKLSKDLQASRVGRDRACNYLDQSRLSGAILSDEGVNFPPRRSSETPFNAWTPTKLLVIELVRKIGFDDSGWRMSMAARMNPLYWTKF